MIVKFLAQGNNGSLWWGSNSRLTGIYQFTVRLSTHCATLNLLYFRNKIRVNVVYRLINNGLDIWCVGINRSLPESWTVVYRLINYSIFVHRLYRQKHGSCYTQFIPLCLPVHCMVIKRYLVVHVFCTKLNFQQSF